ncbi:hypothetical protein N7492_002404 [Penicillium capsulatum]|uniref:Uncharacterized protein n=1 Tax=Penicillium capsulatum TaxID=69766 RepID=A0A9W9IJZ8_9EURO|nr:hypothetical protein N7492_002404 [Penicillium capsulatum]KAJ6122991.1 hypothetical protein N7512_005456 [Penicillium capsulatum]
MDISHTSDQLSSSTKRFPDCCVALSTTVIAGLASLLPRNPAFTLSVGSGSGLLEALIVNRNPDVSVEGVEVDSTINRYIEEERMNVVGGGWGLCSRASQASVWMFVYPRDPKLITKYIDAHADQVEQIVWLGPRVDWLDYEPCFVQSRFSTLTFPNIGLAPYEVVVVARKSAQS